MTNREEKIAKIVEKFSMLKGTRYVGIRGYVNSHEEISNVVVNADFSYGNAVAKDLNTLKSGTMQDVENIAFGSNFSKDLISQAINKMIESFEKNQNPETQSAQSKAQQDTYTKVTNSIKMHNETGQLYIYALQEKKYIVKKGEYKEKNSKDLTLAQNAVKKYFDLSTAKYRSYVIDENKLASVAITGDTLTVI
jgi:hypothetical protein